MCGGVSTVVTCGGVLSAVCLRLLRAVAYLWLVSPAATHVGASSAGSSRLQSTMAQAPRSVKRTKTPILCSGKRGLCSRREEFGTGKRNRCFPAIHRAGQCAPEVPRTRIRARGDLQELRHRQPAAAFAIQYLPLGQATASFGGDTEVA